ncbi:MAG: type II toxin-antitoxin system prevent-host-death family antitoxin [Chloroflexi bacterium]|nr:type II toxin-antitoxin system prevent-host-death family antitoxin [Chloroflexota bacterium]
MIAAELRTMPMHKLRDKASLAIAYAAAGTPVMVFTHGDPSAVLISPEETERWIAIERSLSALHGLDVYPELADDTASLAAVVAGRERPNATAIRRLAREERQILDIPRTIGITHIQRRLASILDEVAEGRPTTIYSSGEFVGVLITPAEYYRLRKLSRVVAWFRTAGLELATADEAAIADFVRRFREGRSSAAESAAG